MENVLISFLDRTRNDWIDDYLEFPFDISNYIIVATINEEKHLSDPLRNRLHIIEFPAYDEEQKIQIVQQFEVPRALEQRGISLNDVVVSNDIVKYIVSKLPKEDGVRTLKRAIESIIQRINFFIQTGSIDSEVDFKIDTFQLPFVVTEKHVDIFLKHLKPSDEKWKSIFI